MFTKLKFMKEKKTVKKKGKYLKENLEN